MSSKEALKIRDEEKLLQMMEMHDKISGEYPILNYNRDKYIGSTIPRFNTISREIINR